VIRWFIGYDPRESLAYYTLAHSIMERASVPVAVTPLALPNLRSMFNRPRDPKQSNDFSFTRFLVPALCQFSGFAIYSDCDMLCRRDPAELWAWRDPRRAVLCVQHDHQPASGTKYLGNVQTTYPRKNWSSVMLLNCFRLTRWSAEYVRTAPGLDLHQFKGIDDEEIGILPPRWNHLVNASPADPDPALVHWTEGGPYFREFEGVPFAAEWWQTYRRLRRVDDPASALIE